MVLWLCSRNPKFGRRIVFGSKRLLLPLRKFLLIWLGHKSLKLFISICSVEHSKGPDKIFLSVVSPLKLLQYQRLWYMPHSEKMRLISIRLPIVCAQLSIQKRHTVPPAIIQISSWLRKWTVLVLYLQFRN